MPPAQRWVMHIQVGSCVAYLIYIVAALSDVLSGIPSVDVSKSEVMAAVAPFLAGLSLLPSPKYLAPTSTLGNVAIVLVRSTLLLLLLQWDHPPSHAHPSCMHMRAPRWPGACYATAPCAARRVRWTTTSWPTHRGCP